MNQPALWGKSVLVTGVSRRRGIGFAVAKRFAQLGASVYIQHWAAHDERQPWGADALSQLRGELRAELFAGASFGERSVDLRDAAELEPLIDAAVELTGRLDILVCNHAQSGGDGSIFEQTAESLDAHWQVNARSSLLLTRYFAERFGPAGEESDFGRVFWMTSGQGHGSMRGEVAYATSKAGLAGITRTVAAELLPRGIILNTVNPGPVNTGYLDEATTDRPDDLEGILAAMPMGRFGAPTDPARLIGWLATPEGRWIVGQVLTSDGGFSL
ncbi:SDR family oxidoreductase [Microbacteriaceae bacterium VKM Ac-2855]|nr:SDR family oxidoreductase [Microbacteriaceae bacterium VKM Ac-2855]